MDENCTLWLLLTFLSFVFISVFRCFNIKTWTSIYCNVMFLYNFGNYLLPYTVLPVDFLVFDILFALFARMNRCRHQFYMWIVYIWNDALAQFNLSFALWMFHFISDSPPANVTQNEFNSQPCPVSELLFGRWSIEIKLIQLL